MGDGSSIRCKTQAKTTGIGETSVDIEPGSQHTGTSEPGNKTTFDDNLKAKPLKDGYAGYEGPKGLEKIPLGDNETLYRTGQGELWYVSEQPDGSTARVQLEEDIDGEINIVDDGKDSQ